MTLHVLLLALAPLASTTPTQEPPDALARVVAGVMAQKRIPGVVIGLVRGGELVERRAFGFSEVREERAMTAERLFQIGSVTKPFTATLAAQLVDEKVLDPDAPIGPWLPRELGIPEEILGLTVRQLASHTAGLPRDPVNRRNVPDSPSVMLPYSTDELYAGLAETRLASSPGERWSYSNLGYALLGHVVERAAGEDYEELLAARICRPLGMRSTGVHPTPEQERALAAHHWPEDDERVARPRWEFGEIAGFSGIFTSVDDLGLFLASQYDAGEKPFLSATERKFLHEPVAEVDPTQGRSMACGWFVSAFPGVGEILGHGGEVDGHSACIAVLPKARVGLIVLANLGGDAAEGLCIALMQQALPTLLAD